jgi:hypothetical protein
VPDAQAQFGKMIRQFMCEEAPLEETKATLLELLQLADDESLTAEYASFLDASVRSTEEQAAARAAMCAILAIDYTAKRRPNADRIEAALQAVAVEAKVKVFHTETASEKKSTQAYAEGIIILLRLVNKVYLSCRSVSEINPSRPRIFWGNSWRTASRSQGRGKKRGKRT